MWFALRFECGLKGWEEMTPEESAKSWASLALRRGGICLVPHVDIAKGSLLKTEQSDINSVLKASSNFSADNSIKIVFKVLESASRLLPGKYLMCHEASSPAIDIYKAMTEAPHVSGSTAAVLSGSSVPMPEGWLPSEILMPQVDDQQQGSSEQTISVDNQEYDLYTAHQSSGVTDSENVPIVPIKWQPDDPSVPQIPGTFPPAHYRSSSTNGTHNCVQGMAPPNCTVQSGDLPSGSFQAGNLPSSDLQTEILTGGTVHLGTLPGGSVQAGTLAGQNHRPLALSSGSAQAGTQPGGHGHARVLSAGDVPVGFLPCGSLKAAASPAGTIQDGTSSGGSTQAIVMSGNREQAGFRPYSSAKAGDPPGGQTVEAETTPGGRGGVMPGSTVRVIPGGIVEVMTAGSIGIMPGSNVPTDVLMDCNVKLGATPGGSTPAKPLSSKQVAHLGQFPSGSLNARAWPGGSKKTIHALHNVASPSGSSKLEDSAGALMGEDELGGSSMDSAKHTEGTPGGPGEDEPKPCGTAEASSLRGKNDDMHVPSADFRPPSNPQMKVSTRSPYLPTGNSSPGLAAPLVKESASTAGKPQKRSASRQLESSHSLSAPGSQVQCPSIQEVGGKQHTSAISVELAEQSSTYAWPSLLEGVAGERVKRQKGGGKWEYRRQIPHCHFFLSPSGCPRGVECGYPHLTHGEVRRLAETSSNFLPMEDQAILERKRAQEVAAEKAWQGMFSSEAAEETAPASSTGKGRGRGGRGGGRGRGRGRGGGRASGRGKGSGRGKVGEGDQADGREARGKARMIEGGGVGK
ncbi:hypothetical protein CBR_g60599 [Chara braunii]|uniref:C3H1-type domain-containing protein n=1 Tax=Chara braunii TaxID=69332 RepID=A0A388MF79_CHABU|nr:hypothetical protein CBR_g60599 [Chara braunii]|eukprot:GBG93211.1 hypothetical protein CBR_g60599 [Chara braunii]